jgi:hypothetical protein
VGILNSDRDNVSALPGWPRENTHHGSDPLVNAFLAIVVYVERDEAGSGLLIQRERDGRRWVYAYSVPDWVPGHDVGQEIDYASLTGRHLVAMVPLEVGIRLDPGYHHAREVRAASVAPAASGIDVDEDQAVMPAAGRVPELVRQARAVHAGTGTREVLLGTFRRSAVYLGRLAGGVPVARLPERGNWICVFSSLDLLLEQWGTDSRYLLLSGRDVVDVLLPAFAGHGGPVGVSLDLGAEHQISLPADLIAMAESGATQSAPDTASNGRRRWWRERCPDATGRRETR